MASEASREHSFVNAETALNFGGKRKKKADCPCLICSVEHRLAKAFYKDIVLFVFVSPIAHQDII